jgi:hypothetical protein
MIVADLTESGTYRWSSLLTMPLTIDQAAASSGRPIENRDIETLTVGRTTSGELASGDQLLVASGSYTTFPKILRRQTT